VLAIIATCLIVLPGPVTEPFAPEGPYAGHWGIDVEVPAAAVVAAPLDGVVTFAGEVAGVKSVTVRDGRFRVSLSYLGRVDVEGGPVRSTGGRGRPSRHTPRGAGTAHRTSGRKTSTSIPFRTLAARGEGTLRLP
jgi:hypothetical protein